MADRSGIEWLKDAAGRKGATWNPIRARDRETGKIGWHCEHASPGCMQPCYAEAMNRRLGTGRAFTPQERARVELFLDETMLAKPLQWRAPRRVFPCSMTDLFADFVKTEWIDEMVAVIAARPLHTFIVATKRGDRQRDYFLENRRGQIYDAAERLDGSIGTGEWPLRNLLLGVSIEDQRFADERRPALRALAKAGWATWASYEPALGPVDWEGWEFLDWLVSGGASGRDAQPSHPAWHRAARDFCARNGIAYHFKQWGAWIEEYPHPGGDLGGDMRADRARFVQPNREPDGHFRKGDVIMYRARKKAAGRLLDGREHDGFPDLERARKAPAA